LHVSTHDPLPVVVVTEWDTDVSGTCFQNQTAGAVFAVFSLFFEDAEGFAGEIWPTFGE
jgi:membrane-associated PAP2 superfamily phosphatase